MAGASTRRTDTQTGKATSPASHTLVHSALLVCLPPYLPRSPLPLPLSLSPSLAADTHMVLQTAFAASKLPPSTLLCPPFSPSPTSLTPSLPLRPPALPSSLSLAPARALASLSKAARPLASKRYKQHQYQALHGDCTKRKGGCYLTGPNLLSLLLSPSPESVKGHFPSHFASLSAKFQRHDSVLEHGYCERG